MKKVKTIKELDAAFSKMTALVIGDAMVDAYMYGKVERISPEAPVPIVTIKKKENRLGGAANVAINIQALGATPILCTMIGDDAAGKTFMEQMHRQHLSTDGILMSKERSTIVKTRVIGNNHQMLRVDDEIEEMISTAERNELFNTIENIFKKNKIDVVIFEDYDKGIISKWMIDAVVALAEAKKIPVAADPKKKNFNLYNNISLFKPNLKELREGLKADIETADVVMLKAASDKVRAEHNIKLVLITLSEKGIFIGHPSFNIILGAHVRNISDVSGAGDTVISVAALCYALGLSPDTVAKLSNLAGGLVCEKVGVVPVDKSELFREAAHLDIF